MSEDYDLIKDKLIVIASEFYRFQHVFQKAISKLDMSEQRKYNSQFAWFSKKVTNALNDLGIRIVNVDGQLYDPGMAVTPLNIEDFEADDSMYVSQTIEPIIMQNYLVIKAGTVILERKNR